MAHYAKIDENNIVVSVHVVSNSSELDDSGNESEAAGINFLTSLHGDVSPNYWKKTSYNTNLGKHMEGKVESYDQSKAFRKNYAGIGYTYDAARDAFIPPRPQKSNGAIVHHSWSFDEDKCWYFPPVEHPEVSNPNSTDYTDENGDAQSMVCSWDEHKGRWMCAKKVDQPDESLMMLAWNPSTTAFDETSFTRAQFLDTSYTGD